MHRPLISTHLTLTKLAHIFGWLLASLVVAGLVVGLLLFSTMVVQECTASGESTSWCISTLRWQAWKHLWS